MREHWNARYREERFAYGETPNEFVKECLDSIAVNGTMLFPAEGEGRNSVYAETLGWKTKSFDMSEAGKEKALQLAKKNNLDGLDYDIVTFQDIDLPNAHYGGVVFNYTHFPLVMKKPFFDKMLKSVKTGGVVIFECFSKNNLPLRAKNPGVGGPDKEEMLYSVDELKELLGDHFQGAVYEKDVYLNEGQYHIGDAKVIRAFGRIA